MIVRRAELKDLDIIMEGARQFTEYIMTNDIGLFFDRDKARPFFTMMIQSPLFIVLVAEDEGKVLGALGAGLTPWFCNASQLVADEVFWWIFPNGREGLAGVRLHKEFLNLCRDMKVSAVGMSAMNRMPNYDKVTRFYERRGFVAFESKYIMGMKG